MQFKCGHAMSGRRQNSSAAKDINPLFRNTKAAGSGRTGRWNSLPAKSGTYIQAHQSGANPRMLPSNINSLTASTAAAVRLVFDMRLNYEFGDWHFPG